MKLLRYLKELLTPDYLYLKYVLRHKKFVYQEGRKLGLGRWALIVHDWQKFSLAEWTPYVLSFYGPWEYKDRPPTLVKLFDRAWLHHIHCGPHHYQYWILNQDDVDNVLLDIPDRYRREMLADWRGAGLAISGKDATKKWYGERRVRFAQTIHPDTLEWLDEQLGISPDHLFALYAHATTNGTVRVRG